jgi:putative methionine-R-sulfoxide reductase with GAF domain
MDFYSILDNSPSQAAPETAPPNLVASGFVPSHIVPAKTAAVKPEPKQAAPVVRDGLRFPGEDGGKSLSEMAQRDLDATLQLLVERAQYITGASGAAIALLQGEMMVCCASAGASAPELGAHLQIDSGLSSESVKTRQVLHCDDADNDPRVNRESCRALGIASVVVMPLARGEEVYGVFELLSGRPRAFEERDFVALNRLAEMIQTAVEHADAARRAEVKLGKPVVTVAAEAVPAEVAAIPASDVVKTDSEKPAPEVKTKPAALTPPEPNLADLHAAESLVAESYQSESHEAVPTVAVSSILVETPELASSAQEGQAETERPMTTIAFGNLRRCETCGFPVSEGRRLCLDCEAATPDAIASVNVDPEIFGELESDTSWVRSHMYLIGTAVVAIATIVLLAWRL